MHPPPLRTLDTRPQLPREIIRQGVWRDVRLCLSDRDVEALMADRGVMLTDEAVRYGCRTFGQVYANQ